jgi:hypothetical protein
MFEIIIITVIFAIALIAREVTLNWSDYDDDDGEDSKKSK